MKVKKLLQILFLSLFFYSCEDKEPTSMHFDTIAGRWKWIKTYKVIPLSDTNPETPANTGIEELLVFNTDFTWYKTQNNVLTDSGSYSLGSGHLDYPELVYDSIAYYKNNTPVKNGFDYYEIHHDTLVFCSYFGGRWSAYTLSHSGTKWWVRQK